MLPIALGLGAAACIGVGDFTAGVASRRIAPLMVAFWTHVVAASLGVLLLFWLKPALLPGQLPWSLAAGVAIGIGLALLYRAMSVGAISLVAPITACAVVLPVIWAVVNGERLEPLPALGIVAVVCGVVLASLQPDSLSGAATGASNTGNRRVIALAIGSALALGIFYILVDIAPQTGDWGALWTAGTARLSALGVQVALVLLGPRRLTGPGRYAPHMLAVGVLDQSALVLLSVGAMTDAYGIVTALMGLYPVVTALLGVFLLGERLTRVQTSGATLALVGVMLISI